MRTHPLSLLRTGRKFGQAVKNVGRLREIVGVLAKNGFVDLVERMHLGRFLVGRLRTFSESQSQLPAPVRLRRAFEELGPTFVKLGQLLSTRSDLLPDAFVAELTRLQDGVQPLSFELVREVVESELGAPLHERFAQFDQAPLASASISQVHAAVLPTGEQVVVKVQRPEIRGIISKDIALLKFLASLLERYVPEARVANPRVLVEEFFQTISLELDFVIEANNMQRMADNLRELTDIVIPRVYRSLSTERVLTQERLYGVRVNDLEALDRAGIDRKRLVQVGSRAFFRTVLIDGLFHGDLHGGNLFALPGNRLGIIDFGIVGRLSERARDQLASMVMALLHEDFEQLCYHYAELGAAEASIDFDGFVRDTRQVLSPYLGLPLHQLKLGRVLIEATKVATRYRIKVPAEWMLVFKAILTTEGMGRRLDPDFDLLASGRELVRELLRKRYSYSRLRRELLVSSRDVIDLVRGLPRQLRWMLRKFNSNDFAFEIKVPELKQLRAQLESSQRRTTHAIAAGALLIAGAIALQDPGLDRVRGYPLSAVVLLGAGLILLLRSLR